MSEQKGNPSQSKHTEILGSLDNFRQIGSFHSQPPALGRLGSIRAKNYIKTETQKMKFKPTIPLKRNKKESTPSLLEDAMSNKTEITPTQRRGRGRGRGKGRGKEVVLTASGPFSMGPTVQVNKGYKSGAENSKEILVGSSRSDISISGSSIDKFDCFEREGSGDEGAFFVDQNEWTPTILPTTSAEAKQEDGSELEEPTERKQPSLAMKIDVEKSTSEQNLLNTIMMEQKASTESGDERLLFFQFPSQLPELVESTSIIKSESKETVKMDIEPVNERPCPTSKMDDGTSHTSPEGLMGKLLIYKSGKMQIRIGDIYLDLNSGLDCSFLQNIVAVDSDNKQAFVMGSIHKRLVCTPNMDTLLS